MGKPRVWAPFAASGASVRCLCSALSRPPEGRPWALTTSVDEISGSTVVTKSQSPNPLGPVGVAGGSWSYLDPIFWLTMKHRGLTISPAQHRNCWELGFNRNPMGGEQSGQTEEVGGPFNGGLGEELFLVRGRQSGLWQLPGGMIEAPGRRNMPLNCDNCDTHTQIIKALGHQWSMLFSSVRLEKRTKE